MNEREIERERLIQLFKSFGVNLLDDIYGRPSVHMDKGWIEIECWDISYAQLQQIHSWYSPIKIHVTPHCLEYPDALLLVTIELRP